MSSIARVLSVWTVLASGALIVASTTGANAGTCKKHYDTAHRISQHHSVLSKRQREERLEEQSGGA